MKNLTNFIIAFTLIFGIASCNKDESDEKKPAPNEKSEITIEVNFDYGEDFSSSAWKNIYVCWLEDDDSDFRQNLVICNKLVNGGLTGTALPYWKMNVYPGSGQSEVDAVTSATIANADFNISQKISNQSIKKFKLYFEIDRSFEPNDWFSDQPALLYAVSIDLDDNINEYELDFIGWTPNENTENIIENTPKGNLQEEVRYITHLKDNNTFGLLDERSATRMVEKITVSMTRN